MQMRLVSLLLIFFASINFANSQVITYTQTIKNSLCGGLNDGAAEITITSTNTPYSFLWSNGGTDNKVDNLSPGDYSVIITDNLGNTTTVNITITELECHFIVDLYFSPNGDEINDTWGISGLADFPNNLVIVYNRMGQKVFESKGEYKPWEGKDLLGRPLPDTTYFYIIYAQKKNKHPSERGSVSIIR